MGEEGVYQEDMREVEGSVMIKSIRCLRRGQIIEGLIVCIGEGGVLSHKTKQRNDGNNFGVFVCWVCVVECKGEGLYSL